MYLLFLDESGTPEDGVFALGGVAIRADCWAEVKERWGLCLESCSWPADKELKWSDIRRGLAPPETAEAAYECLAQLPVECFTTVLYPDLGGYDDFFATPEQTYFTAVTFIAERFQRHLAHHDSHGVIVLDSRTRETDDRMRKFFTLIQEQGTEFAKLDRIVDGMMLGPSHMSLGLQLADLVVGPARAATLKQGDGSRRHKQLIESVYSRHPSTGEVDGVGVKYFPDSTKPRAVNKAEVRLFNPLD